jgi:hypothetical protein
MRGDEKIVLTGRRAEGMQDQIKPHGELAETDPSKLNRGWANYRHRLAARLIVESLNG